MGRSPSRSPVAINPPFAERAKAATARSISPASRTLMGSLLPRATAPWPGYRRIDRYQQEWRDPEGPPSASRRRDLLEEFQPFPTQTVFENHKAGGVAAWPG